MGIQTPLTLDDLANIYDISTGGTARIHTIEAIVDWAIDHPEFVNYDEKEDVFYRKEI